MGTNEDFQKIANAALHDPKIDIPGVIQGLLAWWIQENREQASKHPIIGKHYKRVMKKYTGNTGPTGPTSQTVMSGPPTGTDPDLKKLIDMIMGNSP